MNVHLEKAIHWIYCNRNFFSPLKGKNMPIRVKMFAELQLALLIIDKKLLNNSAAKEFDILCDFSENILNSPEYYEYILAFPDCFRLYGSSAIYYLSHRHSEILINVINKAIPFIKYNECEMEHYSKMDLEHLIMMANKNTNHNILNELYKGSILDSNLDLAFFSRIEEYKLTHSIFYYTDFGKNENIPSGVFDKLEHALLTMGYRSYLKNDMDLLGEYIMCLCFLHSKNNFLDTLFNKYISNQKHDGSFSGPQAPDLIKYSQGIKGLFNHHKKIILDNYHVTFVSVMAITLYILNSK